MFTDIERQCKLYEMGVWFHPKCSLLEVSHTDLTLLYLLNATSVRKEVQGQSYSTYWSLLLLSMSIENSLLLFRANK